MFTCELTAAYQGRAPSRRHGNELHSYYCFPEDFITTLAGKREAHYLVKGCVKKHETHTGSETKQSSPSLRFHSFVLPL